MGKLMGRPGPGPFHRPCGIGVFWSFLVVSRDLCAVCPLSITLSDRGSDRGINNNDPYTVIIASVPHFNNENEVLVQPIARLLQCSVPLSAFNFVSLCRFMPSIVECQNETNKPEKEINKDRSQKSIDWRKGPKSTKHLDSFRLLFVLFVLLGFLVFVLQPTGGVVTLPFFCPSSRPARVAH